MKPADRHLTPQELETLLFGAAGSSINLDASGAWAPEAQHHLKGCAVCQAVAEKYRNAEKALANFESGNNAKNKGQEAKRRNDCPPDKMWLSLAAGLIAEDQAPVYITHAATCDWCGPLLKEAMEDLAPDATPHEQEDLAQLPTVSPGWQRDMARKLAERSENAGPTMAFSEKEKNGRESRQRTGYGWWPKMVWAGAGMVVTAGVWFAVKVTRAPDANQLLAQAYTKQRTIEMRMPGAAYGPLRVERGSGSRDLPAEFYRAEDIIKTESAKHPEDPAWLHAQARADLLQWHYEDAIKELDDALIAQPNNPALLLDKATGLFERAEKIGQSASIDYGEAAEDLTLVLKNDPDQAIGLFNRAIIYERLNLPNQAIDDLEHYLKIAPNGPWAGEARDRLQRLKGTVRSHDQAWAEPLADPNTFARMVAQADGAERLDQRIEEYQDRAIQDWLPAAFAPGMDPKKQERLTAAVTALASMLAERHHDRWMQELLLCPRTREVHEALLLLKKAVLLTPGDAMGAYSAANKAAHLFDLVHNNAGSLRARVEQVHALQRAQQGVRCLDQSRQLASNVYNHEYPWIRIQSQIDRCGCASKVGDFESAAGYVSAAMEEAYTYHYPTLQLRSVGLSAAVQVKKGNVSLGWEGNQQGLGEYWAKPYIAPIRAQQFYDALVYASESVGYRNMAKAFATEDVRAAAASHYTSIEALTRSHLGKLEMQFGELDHAGKEFASAHRLLSSLPATLATRAYLADAEIDLAELEVLRGETGAARKRLDELKPSLKGITSFPIPLRFYQVYAKALEGERETSAAEAAFEQAREIAAVYLQHLADPAGRYSWMQETSGLFRDFVQFELLRGNDETALAIWEWYRTAALSNSPFSHTAGLGLHPILARLKDQTVVSYALLPHGLAVWAFDEQGVYSKFTRLDSKDLAARTRHFLQICGDPKSTLQAVAAESRSLYRIFMAPIENRLVLGRLLVIEADEQLGDIPFQVFQDGAGSYVGNAYPMIYSQGIFYRIEAQSATDVNGTSKALIDASSVIVPGSDSASGVSSEVEREAKVVADHFASSNVLSGEQATANNLKAFLPSVEVFHYGGHAVATRQEEGLVLFDRSQKGASIWSASSNDLHLFHRCKLVVLAACSTGTARTGIKETHGRLVQTMIASGVPHVVASQWDVDSAATAEFMEFFYTALLRDGDVTNAIANARKTIQAQPGRQHPYYWAPFVVFGRGKNPRMG